MIEETHPNCLECSKCGYESHYLDCDIIETGDRRLLCVDCYEIFGEKE